MIADALLFLRISCFAAMVPLLTRFNIRRLEKLVQPRGIRGRPDLGLADKVIRQTEYLCRVARPLIASLCMTRGLTLFFFLTRAGIDTSLVFGVGKVENEVAAHCWLTRNGEPYLEMVDPRPLFAPMYTFQSHVYGNAPDQIRINQDA